MYIDSVGKGAVWVLNIKGPLESGDYITTSGIVPGYGQGQSDDVLHNHRVAKIIMDFDFHPNLVPVQRIVTRVATVTDYVMTRYQDVTRMVYKTLAPDSRQIVIGPDQVEQYQRISRTWFTNPGEGRVAMSRERPVNALDSYSKIQGENVPDRFEYPYQIRYLDATGTPVHTAEAATYVAAFVSCTYHLWSEVVNQLSFHPLYTRATMNDDDQTTPKQGTEIVLGIYVQDKNGATDDYLVYHFGFYNTDSGVYARKFTVWSETLSTGIDGLFPIHDSHHNNFTGVYTEKSGEAAGGWHDSRRRFTRCPRPRPPTNTERGQSDANL